MLESIEQPARSIFANPAFTALLGAFIGAIGSTAGHVIAQWRISKRDAKTLKRAALSEFGGAAFALCRFRSLQHVRALGDAIAIERTKEPDSLKTYLAKSDLLQSDWRKQGDDAEARLAAARCQLFLFEPKEVREEIKALHRRVMEVNPKKPSTETSPMLTTIQNHGIMDQEIEDFLVERAEAHGL